MPPCSASLHCGMLQFQRCSITCAQLPQSFRSSAFIFSLRWAGGFFLMSSGASSQRFLTWSRSKSRSEEHTSELQSRVDLVCRLLLEKKKRISCDTDEW